MMEEKRKFDLAALEESLKSGAIAWRCRRRLQPAEGPGGKVFPSTYDGAVYAEEERVIDGERVPCVVLDSVQSQSNRMEQALRHAYYREGASECEIPLIAVDFESAGLPEIGWITSLDAPHRIADAILRDSLYGGKRFRETEIGKHFTEATAANATVLYGCCPFALTLGIWDSTGPRGGLGTKFQRAVVSEIVAVNAVKGCKTLSRIDPLNIARESATVYEAKDDALLSWTAIESEAKMKGKSALKIKDGKPSNVNHGNIPPKCEQGKGGVTCDYALQTSVLSLAALRKLHFHVKANRFVDDEARVVLAALGLCGVVLSHGELDLRSRCLLVPESACEWECIYADGSVVQYAISAEEVKAVLSAAIDKACEAGLPWNREVMVLTPSKPLVDLVKKSMEKQATIGETEG